MQNVQILYKCSTEIYVYITFITESLNVRNESGMPLSAMAIFSDGKMKVLTHIFTQTQTYMHTKKFK